MCLTISRMYVLYLEKIVLDVKGVPAGLQALVGDTIQVLLPNIRAVTGTSHGVLGEAVRQRREMLR